MTTSDYKKTQEFARAIENFAAYTKKSAMYDMAYNAIGWMLNSIKELGTFASKVAETVENSMNMKNFSVARVSSKQAWILACAAVENGIEFQVTPNLGI